MAVANIGVIVDKTDRPLVGIVNHHGRQRVVCHLGPAALSFDCEPTDVVAAGCEAAAWFRLIAAEIDDAVHAQLCAEHQEALCDAAVARLEDEEVGF